MLLMRFLNINTITSGNASKDVATPTILEDSPPPNFKGSNAQRVRRLVVRAQAINPEFKVLIYPYHQGDALPKTAWINKGAVAVSWPAQNDILQFTPTASGKTNLKVTRSDETLVSIDKPLEPFK